MFLEAVVCVQMPVRKNIIPTSPMDSGPVDNIELITFDFNFVPVGARALLGFNIIYNMLCLLRYCPFQPGMFGGEKKYTKKRTQRVPGESDIMCKIDSIKDIDFELALLKQLHVYFKKQCVPQMYITIFQLNFDEKYHLEKKFDVLQLLQK